MIIGKKKNEHYRFLFKTDKDKVKNVFYSKYDVGVMLSISTRIQNLLKHNVSHH